jgi:phosphoribosyl 1,2-cyclic phosphodiesterase
MRIVVLGSSSSGNSTYVELSNKKFLIDAGLGFNDIKNKLYDLGVSSDELDFILVTHAHSDHVKSIHSFNRVYNTKIYISKGTMEEYSKSDLIKNYEFIDDLDNVEGIDIVKIPISHDRKGFGFIFETKKNSLVYITDTGMIHSKYHKYFMNKQVYLFESNHDVEMEMNGTKDEMTKIRNIGDEGHLSNEECAMYLNRFVGDKTKYICLMHISDHDNTYELAYSVNRDSIDKKIPIIVAYKDKISEEIIIE